VQEPQPPFVDVNTLSRVRLSCHQMIPNIQAPRLKKKPPDLEIGGLFQRGIGAGYFMNTIFFDCSKSPASIR
jgi:hypothetical protein